MASHRRSLVGLHAFVSILEGCWCCYYLQSRRKSFHVGERSVGAVVTSPGHDFVESVPGSIRVFHTGVYTVA